MEPDILHSFQNFIIGVAERVWVKHRARFQGRKLVPAAYMLLVFSPQQVRRLLRDHRRPNRRLSLGFPHCQLAFHSVVSSQRSSLTQHPNSPGKGKGIPAPQTGVSSGKYAARNPLFSASIRYGPRFSFGRSFLPFLQLRGLVPMSWVGQKQAFFDQLFKSMWMPRPL